MPLVNDPLARPKAQDHNWYAEYGHQNRSPKELFARPFCVREQTPGGRRVRYRQGEARSLVTVWIHDRWARSSLQEQD
jgi:hypothetical protein